MNIEDYRNNINYIKFCADSILADKGAHYGNIGLSLILFEKFLGIAQKLALLFDSDTKRLEMNYQDFLSWRLLYEKVGQCHLLLEELADYNFCHGNNKFNNNTALDDCFSNMRSCLDDLAVGTELDYNGDVDSLRLIVSEYRTQTDRTEQYIQKWLPYVKDIFLKIDEYYDDVYDGFKAVIINTYYDKLEDEEDDVRNELYNIIYDKEILKNPAEEPMPEHYGILLKDFLEQAKYNQKTRVIADKFMLGKAINIDEGDYVKHLNKECSTKADIDLFIKTFMQIAILQELTKPRIHVARRPTKHIPLPDGFNVRVSDDIKMNNMLREILARLSTKVGGNFKTKWSHAKRVMEDEEIISKMTDTEFGKEMAEVCSLIHAENCRTNTKNNGIKLKDKDKGKKYYEWVLTLADRSKCMSVAHELKPLLKLMYPDRDFQNFT